MIVIPTVDFLGVLTDVVPLMPADKEDPHHGVRLEWDGERLYAHASDSLSAGISSWHPDEVPEATTVKYGVEYGPTRDGERWSVFVVAPDVAEIVKTFKLPPAHCGVPLHVKVNEASTRLVVERTRDTGRTEHLMTVTPNPDALASFPDIRAQVADLVEEAASVSRLTVWGARLAAFENASRRGPLDFLPTGRDGDDDPIVVRVVAFGAPVFTGYVTPEREPHRGADGLRTGSGLLLGADVTRQDNGTVMVENDGAAFADTVAAAADALYGASRA